MYCKIWPFVTAGGAQVNSISVSERARATTFSGCSGTRGLGVVDRCVVLAVVVVSGVVVGAGVVVGIRSPA